MAEREVVPGPSDDEHSGPRDKVSDGIRQGLGVLAALKDAIEETIIEARDRRDLTPERAREAVRSAMTRAQAAAGEARDRLDLVSRKEFEALRAHVDELRERLDRLDRGTRAAPLPDGSG